MKRAPYAYQDPSTYDPWLAGGRVVLVQEGGYHIDVIAQSVAACTSVLLGDPPPPVSGSSVDEARLVPGRASDIARARRAAAKFWPILEA